MRMLQQQQEISTQELQQRTLLLPLLVVLPLMPLSCKWMYKRSVSRTSQMHFGSSHDHTQCWGR